MCCDVLKLCLILCSSDLLGERLHKFLSGQEMPNATSVGLVPEGVEQSVEDRVCLGQHRKHLWREGLSKHFQPLKPPQPRPRSTKRRRERGKYMFSHHSELRRHDLDVLKASVHAHEHIGTPARQHHPQRQLCVELKVQTGTDV